MSDENFDENTLDFGEHFEEEECGVGSDRETMSLSSSNKRIKEMPIDRLSELPDLLLIHILSFLGVEKAGVTSVLSKRWKFLWAELPRLVFRENWVIEKKLDFVSRVNRTLGIRKGGCLEEFLVKFNNYDTCFASDVDAWVEFSVKNEVKELYLMLYPRGVCAYYTPPQVMYSCSSLIDLHLTRCIMAFSTIEWQSLTSLSLDTVKLNQLLIDDILSSCPVLNSLKLEACWGFNRLEVNSPCLNDLRVDESFEEPYLEISAPYIRDLDVRVFPQGRKWKIKNISSVVTASIHFLDFNGGCTEEVMSNAKEFLEKFKQVKELYIGSQCFEVLSMMVVNGWQLPKFSLQNLTLDCCREYEHIISGIIGMLKSSPDLDTLLLEGYEMGGTIFNLDSTAIGDLDGDLLHLKMIRVDNLADPNGEPLLTLAQILLRRAPALEEMMVMIDVEDANDFVNIGQTLLTYPRSSPKAQIYLISHK
ncbi:hypothetical protein ACS0TY_022378 [Phlomoides rotata]